MGKCHKADAEHPLINLALVWDQCNTIELRAILTIRIMLGMALLTKPLPTKKAPVEIFFHIYFCLTIHNVAIVHLRRVLFSLVAYYIL